MADNFITVIDGSSVRSLLPYPDCITAVREAMIATSAGEAGLPLRQRMMLPNSRDSLGMMPGYLRDPACFGIKLSSLFPNNSAQGRSSHLGVYLLYDGDTGQPLALINAAELTAIRTASASAVATLCLMRGDSTRLTVMGAGEQAHAHIDALLAAHPFADVVIWARHVEKAELLAEHFRRKYAATPNLTITSCPDAAEAVAQADVICTVTGAATPILKGEWLRAGTHVNLVGSSFPDRCEIDETGVTRSRFFVDYRPSAMAQAGELLSAIKSGAVTEACIVAEIGEVLRGKSPGRLHDRDITIYKSLGIAAQDLSAAWHVYQESRRRNAGARVTL
jgi:ornithine cyclodeaminase